MRAFVALLLLCLICTVAPAADLPLKPFSYHEGFEGQAPPVALWASRGAAPTVNFLGPTAEQAFEGKHALKLDITFGDSPYYYYGVSVPVPLAGKLTISARIRLGEGNQASAGFGVNAAYPPTSHTGCGSIQSYRGTTDWKLVEGDLVAIGTEGAAAVVPRHVYGVTGEQTAPMLDRWAIFLQGQPGQRAVVYLDDIRIEGEVPDQKEYLARATTAFDESQAKFRTEVADWGQQLEDLRKVIPQAEATEADAPAFVQSLKGSVVRGEELLASLNKSKYGSPQEVQELRQIITSLRNAPQTLATIRQAKAEGRTYVAYPWNHPTTLMRREAPGGLAAAGGEGLQAAACPGEYESVSAFVFAFRDLTAITASCSDLKGKAGTIPASEVNIRVVKTWFQGASNGIGFTPKKWLIPELLLKDDALVRVDAEQETNYLRSTGADGKTEYLVCSDPDSANLENVRPIDAATLQAVDVKAGAAREFWLTIHVPEKAPAGTYAGTLSFNSSGGKTSLPVQLTVRPFVLQPSRLTYSIYYRARLSADGQPYIDSERRSEEQYRAEMEDMLAHGVPYPTNYLGWDEQLLTKQLQIRKEVGMPAGRFYNLGYGIGPRPAEQLPALQQEIKKWLAFLKPWGYDEVYFYGTDEATGEALESQKATWAACQEAGGKTFVACYKKTFEAMGNLLNTAVLAGTPDPEEGAKYHSVGSEAFCYANPQVGVEDPHIYRRNFGLVLWKSGFDGAMDYAYQHGFNHVWNDFDNRSYRDHNFSYPTVNGVVDTIQWEGFREGVDDVRYVTALEQAIKAAAPAKQQTAAAAQKWLDELDPQRGDLDEIRAKTVEWIGKVR
ncbi:MAG: hypothetical protein KKI08_13880 [Armatimonadetes bacterium]|nr:hypothetical protein [Armatimonadota bacterium]